MNLPRARLEEISSVSFSHTTAGRDRRNHSRSREPAMSRTWFLIKNCVYIATFAPSLPLLLLSAVGHGRAPPHITLRVPFVRIVSGDRASERERGGGWKAS